MTIFIGKGSLNKYSQIIKIRHPIMVNEVCKFLKLPKGIAENLIVVRQNKKLDEEELIQDEDQIYIFFAAMGG
jgi:hypothetical protein